MPPTLKGLQQMAASRLPCDFKVLQSPGQTTQSQGLRERNPAKRLQSTLKSEVMWHMPQTCECIKAPNDANMRVTQTCESSNSRRPPADGCLETALRLQSASKPGTSHTTPTSWGTQFRQATPKYFKVGGQCGECLKLSNGSDV